MSQRTLVLKVAPAGRAALETRLQTGDFEWRQVPHALFSVRGSGTVATLYASGKLVVQSADPEAFLARWTDLEAPAPAGPSPAESDAIARTDQPTVGADETGKGDYFGPLVVAAVRLDPDQARRLGELGVADSKKLSDPKALRLAAGLRATDHAIERLDPPEYNQAYPRFDGLNHLLAGQHTKVIAKAAREGDRVLVDQFANERVMQEATAHLGIKLEQAPRAERNVAVAAASILARAEFLIALHELSERFEIDLRKGAGPLTDQAAVAFVHKHGREALGEVAKLHFKNTAKVEAAL